jgi:hypothetical protein
MKKLEELVEVRNELRTRLDYSKRERRAIYQFNGKNQVEFKDLNNEDKKDYGWLLQVEKMLQVQIDTLTYVINYDSELMDVTEKPVIKHT